jgi:citrate synthase
LTIEDILKAQKSSGLCLNVDGAIGALIADMGISPDAGKATFILPRTIGILGELLEQASGSFFRLANESIIYTGPTPGRKFTPTNAA